MVVCRENSAIKRAALVATVEAAADRGSAKRPKDGTSVGVRAERAFATGKPLSVPAPPERRHAMEAAAA
jgi:hypothetical protein